MIPVVSYTVKSKRNALKNTFEEGILFISGRKAK